MNPADRLARARMNLRDGIQRQGNLLTFTDAPVEKTCRIEGCKYPIVRHFALLFEDGTIRITSACDEHCQEVMDALHDKAKERPKHALDIWLRDKKASEE